MTNEKSFIETAQIDELDRYQVFFDANAMATATHRLNIKLDYAELFKYFGRDGRFSRAKYYNTQTENTHEKTLKMLNYISKIGFDRVDVMGEDFDEGDGYIKVSGSVVPSMSIDIYKAAINSNIQHIVIFSNDSELVPAIKAAIQDGQVRVTLVSLAGITSRVLPNACDNTVCLETLLNDNEFLLFGN